MNTIIALYLYSVVALGHSNQAYAARDWVHKGDFASFESCSKAAAELEAIDRFKCIDTGIPFKN